MKTQIKRWGNSLALRIPKVFAEEVKLENNSYCNILLENGRLVIDPETDREPTLGELLAKVTDENVHSEVDWGPAVGAEEW
jgi:antitoxin MazE